MFWSSVFFKDFKMFEFFSPLRGKNVWKKCLNFFAASRRKFLKKVFEFFPPLRGENSWKKCLKTQLRSHFFDFFEEKMKISIKESIKNAWKLQKYWTLLEVIELSRWKCLKKILIFSSPFRGENVWKKCLNFFRRFAAKMFEFFSTAASRRSKNFNWKNVLKKNTAHGKDL